MKPQLVQTQEKQTSRFTLFSKYENGRVRNLRFDVNALADFEQETGMGFAQLMKQKAIFGTARAMAWGATLSVLCADQMDLEASPRPATAGFTGDSFQRFWQTACTNWPHAMTAPSLRTALRSRVPVLVLSGGLDPITPPASGAAVAAQFKFALHAIAPDASHNVSDLGCAPSVLRDFIDSASTDTAVACLKEYRRPDLFIGRRLL